MRPTQPLADTPNGLKRAITETWNNFKESKVFAFVVLIGFLVFFLPLYALYGAVTNTFSHDSSAAAIGKK